MSIYEGWQLIVLERFDLHKALQAIEKYRITFAYIPPPVVLAFSKHPDVEKYDLSSLKVLHSGAAPLTRELTEAVWNRLKVPVKQGFGLSETSAVVCCQTVDEWAKFMGSVGKIMPNMEAKIVDEHGKEVPEGEAGELWLKGPNVFPGYFKNPERTKEAFSPDGFFKTGDIFRRDKHGNYYCVDRVKELIKYSKSSPSYLQTSQVNTYFQIQMVTLSHQLNSRAYFWVTRTWLMPVSLVLRIEREQPKFHVLM